MRPSSNYFFHLISYYKYYSPSGLGGVVGVGRVVGQIGQHSPGGTTGLSQSGCSQRTAAQSAI